jgi:hypothetical protein
VILGLPFFDDKEIKHIFIDNVERYIKSNETFKDFFIETY